MSNEDWNHYYNKKECLFPVKAVQYNRAGNVVFEWLCNRVLWAAISALQYRMNRTISGEVEHNSKWSESVLEN